MPDTTVPIITVWQPWASLIAAGCKPYEFRRWEAPASLHGRRIGIHAGVRKVVRAEVQELIHRVTRDGRRGTALVPTPSLVLLHRWLTAPGLLPLSSIVCTALLGTPQRAAELFDGTDAAVNDSDRTDEAVWAWPLTDVQPLRPVVPARGRQGFWPHPLDHQEHHA